MAVQSVAQLSGHPRHQFAAAVAHGVDAEAVAKLLHPLGAHPASRHLAAQVAEGFDGMRLFAAMNLSISGLTWPRT